MKKGLKSIGLPVGGASLIMAFMLLCLTTFSGISYMSAKRDYTLSLKTAENITEYYAADCQGEKILKDISKDIRNRVALDEIIKKYSDYNISVEFENNEAKAEYSVPIKDEMVLEVNAIITNKKTEVKKWKVANNSVIGDTTVILDLPAF